MLIKKLKKVIKTIFVASISILVLASCSRNIQNTGNSIETSPIQLDEDAPYTSKEEVALYIYTYKKLPSNYITKDEAKRLGWDNAKGNLGEILKGKSIGGDVFGNYEKNLPVVKGRKYYECDIDFDGKKRNAKRIVYADDFDEEIGFIYYTDDHYKTFERLY